MSKRMLLPIAATLAFAAYTLPPEPASAAWLGTSAASTHASQADWSDVTDVRSRGRHGRHSHRRHGFQYSWAFPFAAAPFYGPSYGYYYFGPHKRRCGYVWSPRHYRHVWSCW